MLFKFLRKMKSSDSLNVSHNVLKVLKQHIKLNIDLKS